MNGKKITLKSMKNIKNIISKVSIVVPCYNEENNLPVLYDELKKFDAELVLIDDGSQDRTWEVIKSLSKNNPKVIGLALSRNFGHQAALSAGLSKASGDAIITMDGDLQHPAKLIPKLIKEWQKGFKIVNTKRLKTEKISLIKNFLSKSFYFTFNKISNFKIEPGSSDFRLIDKSVLNLFNQIQSKNKFFRGLVSWSGLPSTVVEYEAPERLHGESGYSLRKEMDLAGAGITSFSHLPLKLILLFGLLLCFLSAILFIVVFVVRFFDKEFFSGAALFGSFILMNTGFMIFILGIIAQYQASLSQQISKLPEYIIKETVND